MRDTNNLFALCSFDRWIHRVDLVRPHSLAGFAYSLLLEICVVAPESGLDLSAFSTYALRDERRFRTLGHWLVRASQEYFEEPLTATDLLSRPETLVRYGFGFLEFGVEEADSVALAAGLCTFGLGALYLASTWRCESCYRNRRPGQHRCEFHSRDKVANRSTTKTMVRRAERLRSIFVLPGISARTDSSRRLDALESLNAILYSESAWAESGASILASLDKWPKMREMLPSDFDALSATRKLGSLRALIDANEFRPSVWPTKIPIALQWWEQEGFHEVPRWTAKPTQNAAVAWQCLSQ
jgi:hypothetical protein